MFYISVGGQNICPTVYYYLAIVIYVKMIDNNKNSELIHYHDENTNN